MYCAVLIGPTGDHDSIRQGPGCSEEGQLAVHSGASQLEENNQHSLNSTPGLLCPEAQVNRARNTTPRTHVNEEDVEDGVEEEEDDVAVQQHDS